MIVLAGPVLKQHWIHQPRRGDPTYLPFHFQALHRATLVLQLGFHRTHLPEREPCLSGLSFAILLTFALASIGGRLLARWLSRSSIGLVVPTAGFPMTFLAAKVAGHVLVWGLLVLLLGFPFSSFGAFATLRASFEGIQFHRCSTSTVSICLCCLLLCVGD